MTDDTYSGAGATARERAENYFADAIEHLQAADETPTEPTEATHIGWAQVSLLRAIYEELRHGHDLAAGHVEAITKNTAALAEHDDGMDDLRKALLFNGDMRGR